ncbi:uncharacterized protein LOC127798949 [Diospyros lotus]|uniref:uncharacterized protein LOC127798949 n=1 Tax=Diospyros lotus TaxID=55363 RepID=UPI0022534647|nr:uncharacterized protein LOC127798949 [Diospyros lotus]
MTLLTSCWFIIESVIIPNGFVKWFYLSFYVHPLLLFLCQIFLWLKQLTAWLLLIFSLPIRMVFFVASNIFRRFRMAHNIAAVAVVDEVDVPEVAVQNQIARCPYWKTVSEEYEGRTYDVVMEELEFDEKAGSREEEGNLQNDEETSSSAMEDEEMAGSSSSSSILNVEDVKESDPHLPSLCRSNSLSIEGGLVDERKEEESDSFYQKYTERMRWFDLLNHDRTCGISAILNEQLASPLWFERRKTLEFSITGNSKMGRRILRSLEIDLELVYVAQSCLSWEALHYQYRKVEALASSSSPITIAFHDNVAERFQKFQILVERFTEDERCRGEERYRNYVHGRSSLKSLLQVPALSGHVEEGEAGSIKGEAESAKEVVLKGIEKCIEAFWIYVKADKKKAQWNFKSFFWNCPPVEDPRDLRLLADLTDILKNKEQWLKGLQGKKCWLRRAVNPLEESQKKEILFATIDMRLVSRVLKMSMISNSQLKWCQEKLSNIEFKDGKVMREGTCSLFPSS